MKHRILAAMICVCAALTSLCVPALADHTEAETPVPVEATPAPAEATPAPVEATPAPVEATPAPIVEESEEQPLEAANVPSVRANWNDPKINGTFLEVGTYYKNDPSDNRGFSEATADDYNFYFDGTTLFLRNADLKGTGNQPMGSALLSISILAARWGCISARSSTAGKQISAGIICRLSLRRVPIRAECR